MSDTRQHYNLAKDGKATQKSDLKNGPEVPKTDFAGTGGAKTTPPMGKGKR